MSSQTEESQWSSERTKVRTRVIDPRGANGAGLPLCIEPINPVETAELLKWIAERKEQLSEAILRHGTVLLRGFPIHSAHVFEETLLALGAELKCDYQGTSPRNAVTRYIFNASELPGFYPIPQHCEMSFLRDPPRRLFFCCLVAPQSFGERLPYVISGPCYVISILRYGVASKPKESASFATTEAPKEVAAVICGSSSLGTIFLDPPTALSSRKSANRSVKNSSGCPMVDCV